MTSGSNNSTQIRKAASQDLDAVKRLADRNRDALGFVLRPSLREQIDKGEMLVAEQEGQLAGFVDYHQRKDRQLTLYHIAVLADQQGQGVGYALLDALQAIARHAGCSKIVLKCPIDLEANHFYQRYGFQLLQTLNGRKRPLHVWILSL